MEKRRRFTLEFKREAVRLLRAAKKPAAELARELGIPRNRLYKWAEDVEKRGSGLSGRTLGSGLSSYHRRGWTHAQFPNATETARRHQYNQTTPIATPACFLMRSGAI
ncbi:transposase [Dokdonella sp.]|uniref:transposase n=1 Tax=Dokdonella sp. TaxID=2291710 RepID=UPI003527682F